MAFRERTRLGAVLVLAGLGFFCSLVSKDIRAADPVRVIDSVPFYEQEDNQCGPASLAGLMNFYGVRITPQEIAMHIFSPTAGGTLDRDMVLFAEKKGLSARQYRGDIDDLRKQIDRGRPLIILVDEGFFVYQRNHYMVVVGYDDRGVIVNSRQDRHRFIPTEALKGSWERTGFWTLLVLPNSEK